MTESEPIPFVISEEQQERLAKTLVEAMEKKISLTMAQKVTDLTKGLLRDSRLNYGDTVVVNYNVEFKLPSHPSVRRLIVEIRDISEKVVEEVVFVMY